jgi:pimeloyl-ACP methyl ester carboxylesterase
MKGEMMLNYIDIGSGKPLILIQGLGQRYDKAWQPQYELAEKYRLIIPSLRGHFGSDIDEDITVENMASDIIELLEERLHIESAFVLGLSLGGIVAQELYKQRPDMVEGLILSNTTFLIPSIFVNSIVKESEKLFYEDKNKLIEQIANKGLRDKSYIQEAINTFYLRDTYLESAKSGMDRNYINTLLQINKPTLLIGSTWDEVTPTYNTFMMKWIIKSSEISILNSGHLSNIECREQFNNRIREFIA